MDLDLQIPEAGYVFLLFGTEGIKNRFVLAGRIEPALDPKLGDGRGKTEARENDADAADYRGLVSKNFISGQGQQVAARSGHILGKDQDRNILFFGQGPHPLHDQGRSHRSAPI